MITVREVNSEVKGVGFVEASAVTFKGYKQGYIVKINGVKYPLARGYWYTDMSSSEAIERALADNQASIENIVGGVG